MIILKNAFVLTLNKDNELGNYSILIKDDTISEMVRSDTPYGIETLGKWEEIYKDSAEIIDCSNMLLMPPFVNSCLKSEGSLIHYLLKRRHYENTENDICTDLIFNYLYQELPSDEVKSDLLNIYNYSFARNIKSGILYLNEFSMRSDSNHLPLISEASKISGQKISVAYPIKHDTEIIRDYKFLNPCFYLTGENHLTVYDISQIAQLKNHNLCWLFIEAATNKQVTEKFRQTFHKSLVALLDEYSLIDSRTSFINPLYLTYDDMKIITERGASVIICPRDLIHFTNKYFPIDEFIGHGIKFCIGTGWLGEDIMKEVRLFRNKYKELNLSSAELLHSVTKVPYELYFDGTTPLSVSTGSPANIIMISLSDVRFQFFPEDTDFSRVCDFIIDNLSSVNVTSAIIRGKFVIKNHTIITTDESKLIEKVRDTRIRLYKTGRYEEIKRRTDDKRKSESPEIRQKSENEIKLFPETAEEFNDSENKEEFRIKTKLTFPRRKKIPGQSSLFDDISEINIIQSENIQNSPVLNFLFADEPAEKIPEENEITVKSLDETIMNKLIPESRTEIVKKAGYESKIELPKDVKLRFGDD